MVQSLIVGLIVVAAACYCAWALMPAALRRAGAARLARQAGRAGLDAATADALQARLARVSACSECANCKGCGPTRTSSDATRRG